MLLAKQYILSLLEANPWGFWVTGLYSTEISTPRPATHLSWSFLTWYSKNSVNAYCSPFQNQCTTVQWNSNSLEFIILCDALSLIPLFSIRVNCACQDLSADNRAYWQHWGLSYVTSLLRHNTDPLHLICFSCTKLASPLWGLLPKKWCNTGTIITDYIVTQSNKDENWGRRTIQDSQET